ncbi:MAG: phage N-6-adenine-methyltransferase [Mesorhizobium sp.]|nr:DNA N-6-adenine-methyltransferase [Mesorhizobium sp.]MCO5159655.1 phage N-6-adenine-methyltransferase [Mesorhizobium sp.]
MSLAHQIRPNGIASQALSAMAGNGAGLVRYERMVAAIAEAKSVDEVKDIRDTAEAMRAAARVAKNKQAEVDLAEIRFRGERRLGELMAMQRAEHGTAQGRRSDLGFSETQVAEVPITLAEAGIDKNLADRARKFAAIPEQEFNSTISDWRARVEEENERVTVNLLAAGDKHVRGTFGTGENEWYTPGDHIALARAVLGEIDLDPASSHVANQTVKASRFFSQETNGLEQEWLGRIWLNPPYAQPAIAHFADKMVAEWEAKRVTAAIVLTHNYTDTAWFQKLARAATAMCFTRGRVRFVSPTGELAAPTQGQAFFYFGHDVDAFAASFGEVGFVVEVRQ